MIKSTNFSVPPSFLKVQIALTRDELSSILLILTDVFEDIDVLEGVFPEHKQRGLARDAYDKLKRASCIRSDDPQ